MTDKTSVTLPGTGAKLDRLIELLCLWIGHFRGPLPLGCDSISDRLLRRSNCVSGKLNDAILESEQHQFTH
jgi:predicted solute-binding protein